MKKYIGWIIGGVIVLGVGIFFLKRKNSTATTGGLTVSTGSAANSNGIFDAIFSGQAAYAKAKAEINKPTTGGSSDSQKVGAYLSAARSGVGLLKQAGSLFSGWFNSPSAQPSYVDTVDFSQPSYYDNFYSSDLPSFDSYDGYSNVA